MTAAEAEKNMDEEYPQTGLPDANTPLWILRVRNDNTNHSLRDKNDSLI